MNFYFPKNWNITKVIVIAIFYVTTVSSIQSQQNKIDSLSKEILKYKLRKGFSEQDSSYILSLTDLGGYYRYTNSDSLLSIAKKSLNLSQASNFEHGITKSYALFGDYYSAKGNHEKAIANYEKALEIAEEQKYKYHKLSVLNSIGLEHTLLGDYAKALNSYLKGIDLAKEVNDQSLLSMFNDNIGNLYVSQKDYKHSLAFYEKAVEINEKLGNEVFSAETFSNVAFTYAEMKKFNYAMFNINKSISTFEKYQIFDWLAYAYEVKGRIYLGQKKYKWAQHWYEQSNLIHKKIDDDRGKIHTLNGLSKTYLGLEKDSLAMAYAKEGFEIATTINYLEGQNDCSKTLYKIYKKNNDLTSALFYHELYKKLSDSISSDDNKKSLSLLIAKLDYEKQKDLLIEKNDRVLARQRAIIYVSLSILLILGIIIFIVVRSQNAQKRLNSKLRHKTILIQKREIELNEINKTKNKLFSIIGHDLRGPIGALQELLRMFSNGDIKKDELNSFIPKLKSDVDNVFFTLNNLLSWGQSQMNGSTTKPKNFSITNLVDRNIKLLSEMAENKSIKVINHIKDAPIAWADQNQIDIVIRNLISNSLKFTTENGLITISAVDDGNYWKVQVKDTGVGMTLDMQQKILSDYSNVTTYGTNNEKGTGLGLSLCREMVEKNNGKIWVDSKVNKGSIFHFTLPKERSKYKQAG